MAKSDQLFVTEAECAERIGVSTDEFKSIALVLEKSGFPLQDPLFKNRRYWPAVKAWLDRRYGLEEDDFVRGLPGLDGKESWK